ncbi:hypothetical protein C8F01DRAFT_1121271 [Mycena amicta]|nr:hypothetical protein C8F01DRAFT_1121271 [Mycena amicta]
MSSVDIHSISPVFPASDVGNTLMDNIDAMAQTLEGLKQAVTYCARLSAPLSILVPKKEAPAMQLLRRAACELRSFAISIRLIIDGLLLLYVKRSDAMDLAAARTALYSWLNDARASYDQLTLIYKDDALPRALCGKWNLWPAFWQLLRLNPPRMHLWRELKRLPTVVESMGRVLQAASTLVDFAENIMNVGMAESDLAAGKEFFSRLHLGLRGSDACHNLTRIARALARRDIV